MNQKIKFRGKRISNGKMIIGHLYQSHVQSWITDSININLNTHQNIAWFEVDPKTVGQFTGLRDKAGTEIFVGDVMANPEVSALHSWLIGFHNGTFNLRNIDIDGNLIGDKFPLEQGNASTRVIIGNIYENPELIKK